MTGKQRRRTDDVAPVVPIRSRPWLCERQAPDDDDTAPAPVIDLAAERRRRRQKETSSE